MTDGSTNFVPLSPPSSPRMSAYNADPSGSEWQETGKPLDHNQPSPADSMALMQAEVQRPMLRSHKSFPYTLRTSGTNIHGANTPDSTGASQISSTERIQISNLEDLETNGELPTVTYGGSAPASPVSRLTPPSPTGDKIDPSQDALDDDTIVDEVPTEEPKAPMTAQELRAQKRKMKRFRLTHNQTRFLMSEFARQAHPDAAHRERLAREIPGLSPRQVQVWFQNRRAKLKRLTSEDRDRMMRSRALPDDFDMAQALHSPFGASAHGVGTPLTSPTSYTPTFPEGNMIRPLSIDTLRRVPEHLSPTGISPAFGGFTFTPPQSATDTLSPVSASPDSFQFPPAPLDSSPRRSNPFTGSVTSGPATYGSHHPNIPRLQLHDRINRTRSESLHSPLRTTMTYDGSLNGADPAHSIDAQLDGSQRSVLPYGLGYSYTQIPGFQASQRMRSYSGSVPRRIELSTATHQYTTTRSTTISTPQTASFPNFGSAVSSPIGTPPGYQVPHMSAPHHITSFPNSYLRSDGSQGEPYHPVGAVLGEVVEGQSQDSDDGQGHY